MPEMSEAYSWEGRNLIDDAGEKVGKIDQLYEDERSGRPEWALVHTGLFGTRSHFVPLAGASTRGEDVQVRASKELIKDAPSIEADQELSETEERRLFEHYGVPYTEQGTTTAEGVPGDERPAPGAGEDETEIADPAQRGDITRADHGDAGDEVMTRSEEELRVGTRSREAGRVRLRKYVTTEMVTKTVPVQREEVRLEREPVSAERAGGTRSGAEISEAEQEVVLHEEEPVVEKQVVPKERVRLDTDVVQDEREVTEEVRKEQIDTEGLEDRTA